MNRPESRKFLLTLLLLSIVLYALLYTFFTYIKPSPIPLAYMILLLFTVTCVTYLILVQTKEKNPRLFVYSYMILSFSRLILFGSFIFIYALSHRQEAQLFAITFFILYLSYTIYEIKGLKDYFKKG